MTKGTDETSTTTDQTCTGCKLTKPVEDFGKHRNNKDGLQTWCKECKAKHYQANKATIGAKRREYLATNPEAKAAKAAADAARYAANREQIIARTQQWKADRWGNRPADKPWPESACGYTAAHERVRAIYGRASVHSCVDCGGPATEWSYRGGAEVELTEWGANPRGEPILRPYSTDPEDYDPRCKSCHRKFDRPQARQAREAVSAA